MRRKYEPESVAVVFVAISPPRQPDATCRRHFYNEEHRARRGFRWELSRILRSLSTELHLVHLGQPQNRQHDLGGEAAHFLRAFQQDGLYLVDLYPWPAKNSREVRIFLGRNGIPLPSVDELSECEPRSAVVLWKGVPKAILEELGDLLGLEPDVTYFPYPRNPPREKVRTHIETTIRRAWLRIPQEY